MKKSEKWRRVRNEVEEEGGREREEKKKENEIERGEGERREEKEEMDVIIWR